MIAKYYFPKVSTNILETVGDFQLVDLRHSLFEMLSPQGGCKEIELPLTETVHTRPHDKPIGIALTVADALNLLEHMQTYLLLPYAFDKLPQKHQQLVEQRFKHQLSFAVFSKQHAKQLRKLIPSRMLVLLLPLPTTDKSNSSNAAAKQYYCPSFKATVIDSNSFRGDRQIFEVADLGGLHPEKGPVKIPWKKTPFKMEFKASKFGASYLEGFYAAEPWGCWSLSETPCIDLPHLLIGKFELTITLMGYGNNIGREININIGPLNAKITLTKKPETYTLAVELDSYESVIHFTGLDLSPPKDALDTRTMGIGLFSLGVEPTSDSPLTSPRNTNHIKANLAHIEGTIYTSFLSSDISHKRYRYRYLISAFTEAFRDQPKATLIIRVPSTLALDESMRVALTASRCRPYRCRVIMLIGSGSNTEAQDLISHSSFYININARQHTPFPDVQFAMSGVPVIHPNHKIIAEMLPYTTDQTATLTYNSSLEPESIPHPDFENKVELQQRLDWESLVKTLKASFELGENSDKYQTLIKQTKQINKYLEPSPLEKTFSAVKKISRHVKTTVIRDNQ